MIGATARAVGTAADRLLAPVWSAWRGFRRGLARAVRLVLPPARAGRLLDACDRHGWTLLAVAAVLFGVLPAVGLHAGFYMTVVIEMFLFSVLALAWDVVGGQTGYPSFGNMVFFGVGLYTTSILTKSIGLGPAPGFVLGGLLALAFAGAVGVIVLRLRGGYFAIATLGVLLTAQQVSRNLEITGGASGIILLHKPPAWVVYYVFLGLLVLEVATVYYLSRTRFGLVLNAVRDDEGKAIAMGVNTTYYKTAAWMLAALFTGFAGGAWSLFYTFVDPGTAYNAAWNVEIIAMALLGGTGTVVGPVLGAVGLHGLVKVVETEAAGWQLVIVGLAVIVTVVAFPRGIVGTVADYAAEFEYYRHGGGSQAEDAATDAGTNPGPSGGESG